MSVVVLAGMIALGKSSLAELLGKELGYEVFNESVEDNPILPLFYTASPEEIQSKRYPFLLQLHFLDTRFRAIKKALNHKNNVLDRSIYEDWYFAKKNHEMGRISQMEFDIYEKLLHNMMDETEGMSKKAPDLLIYLKGSFETVIKRIQNRGRDFELDEGLKDYYYKIWEGYDEWLSNHYSSSPYIIVDMDELDYVNNPTDAAYVVDRVKHALEVCRLTTGYLSGYMFTIKKQK